MNNDCKQITARRLALLVLLIVSATATTAQEAKGLPAPDWYLEHNEFLTRDGGVFHADNSPYLSDDEPWDAYGLAWEKGSSGQTVHGRLFGLRDGRESGTFWEFFVYWNAGEGRAYMIQVGGNGAVGIGALEPPDADGSHRSEQTFYRPGAEPSRVSHVVRNEGDVHDTESFDWIDGDWKPRRAYTWRRVKPARD